MSLRCSGHNLTGPPTEPLGNDLTARQTTSPSMTSNVLGLTACASGVEESGWCLDFKAETMTSLNSATCLPSLQGG